MISTSKLGLVIAAAASIVVACKSRPQDSETRALGDVKLESIPPEVVYHFGPLKFLREFGKTQGSFTEQFWTQIPSNSGKRGGASRAGFYVSQHPAYNERYESDGITKAREDSPWMITVGLARECLEPSAFLNVRARTWKNCSESDFARGRPPSEQCDAEIFDFITKHRIGVVKDFWWDEYGFWYVTRRECIESLDSTAESFLETAASVPEFWRMSPYESNLRRDGADKSEYEPGEVSFVVLIRALYEAKSLKPDLMARLEQSTKNSDLPRVKSNLQALTKHALRCAKAGKEKEFKAQLSILLGSLDNPANAKSRKSLKVLAESLTTEWLPNLNQLCAEGQPPEKGPLAAYAGDWRSSDGSILKIDQYGGCAIRRPGWLDFEDLEVVDMGQRVVGLRSQKMNFNALPADPRRMVVVDDNGSKLEFKRK